MASKRLSENLSFYLDCKKTMNSAINALADQSENSGYNWLTDPRRIAKTKLDADSAKLLYNSLHVIADKLSIFKYLTSNPQDVKDFASVLHHFAWKQLCKTHLD